jgi:cyclopropane-fatty-acyl-phospholipid synthase
MAAMPGSHLQSEVRKLLSQAGVRVGGEQPWDIRVHDDRFYARVLRHGSTGLGESYMDGWWDCPRLDEFFMRIFAAGLDGREAWNWRTLALWLESFLSNPQTKTRSTQVAERHYDLGNDIFQAMLDPRMVYTCGRWAGVATLEEAQESKLDYVCRKLRLEPGMKLLDIGCGWGSFAGFAAEKYGAEVVGITLSRRQLELGRELCAGLPVELRLQDYREVGGAFDRVVSLGMFEHVGQRNYRVFFDTARRVLPDNGAFFLSVIGSNRSVRHTDPWIERYIFPNSHLPSISQIGRAIEGRFLMDDWQNWAADYDRTLLAWLGNFERSQASLQARYGERFCRMWRFYLLISAASFRGRRLQSWHILLSPAGEGTAAPAADGRC